MEQKNRKIEINDLDFLNDLHDHVVSNIHYYNGQLVFEIFNNLNISSEIICTVRILLDENYEDYINIYNYKFVNNGAIIGNLKEYSFISSKSFAFQLIDCGFMHKTFFIKGSILDKNENLESDYVIIEIIFENKDIEIYVEGK